MTQTKPTRPPGRGRLFPEYTIPPEELAKREAEKMLVVKKLADFLIRFALN
ncbi:hypothetical protein NDA00_22850 [Funiculus sociatus GB2-M2]|nr:hypothetical protein [Trichocoleus sp. FACHB-90]